MYILKVLYVGKKIENSMNASCGTLSLDSLVFLRGNYQRKNSKIGDGFMMVCSTNSNAFLYDLI